MADREHLKPPTQKATEQVMRAAGQTVNDRPSVPSKEDRELRAKLHFEECLETIEALGCRLYDFTYNAIRPKSESVKIEALPDSEFDLIDAIDGCVDSMVISFGTLSTIGVPARPFMQEVDRANVRKILPDGTMTRREDGKFLKPDGWTPPDHDRVLREVFRPIPAEAAQ